MGNRAEPLVYGPDGRIYVANDLVVQGAFSVDHLVVAGAFSSNSLAIAAAASTNTLSVSASGVADGSNSVTVAGSGGNFNVYGNGSISVGNRGVGVTQAPLQTNVIVTPTAQPWHAPAYFTYLDESVGGDYDGVGCFFYQGNAAPLPFAPASVPLYRGFSNIRGVHAEVHRTRTKDTPAQTAIDASARTVAHTFGADISCATAVSSNLSAPINAVSETGGIYLSNQGRGAMPAASAQSQQLWSSAASGSARPTVTAGTFTLTYTTVKVIAGVLTTNAQTTAAFANYSGTIYAADVQTALQGLSNLGAGAVLCTGGPIGNAPSCAYPINIILMGPEFTAAQDANNYTVSATLAVTGDTLTPGGGTHVVIDHISEIGRKAACGIYIQGEDNFQYGLVWSGGTDTTQADLSRPFFAVKEPGYIGRMVDPQYALHLRETNGLWRQYGSPPTLVAGMPLSPPAPECLALGLDAHGQAQILPEHTLIQTEHDCGDTYPQTLALAGRTSPAKRLILGYHVTNLYGSIQAESAASTPSSLQINAEGGDILLGKASIATTATSGFPCIPITSDIPTGNAGVTGLAPIVYDSLHSKLWINSGGTTWKGVVVA